MVYLELKHTLKHAVITSLSSILFLINCKLCITISAIALLLDTTESESFKYKVKK